MVYMSNRASINHRLLNAARLAIDAAAHSNHDSDFDARRTAKAAAAELEAAIELLHNNCLDINQHERTPDNQIFNELHAQIPLPRHR